MNTIPYLTKILDKGVGEFKYLGRAFIIFINLFKVGRGLFARLGILRETTNQTYVFQIIIAAGYQDSLHSIASPPEEGGY